MDTKIIFHDCEIQKLLQSFYLIPDYQREYVWEEKQVTQLLNDIFDQFSNNAEAEYFLGTIVICKDKLSNKFEVIDGQQRLITLSLILNAFRRLLEEHSEEIGHIKKLLYSFTSTPKGEAISSQILEVQYEGKEVLTDLYELRLDQAIQFNLIDGKPGKTIHDAHDAIECFLKDTFSYPEEIDQLKYFSGYILNNVKIIQIETPDIGSALKIFETINERGIGLDNVDLLKNLLFMQIDRKNFIKLKTDWNKFKKSIQGGRTKEKPLRFLRYFIMANYAVKPDEKGSKIIREDNVYSWFVNNEKECNYQSNSFNFVRKLQESANFYINLMNNKFHEQKNLYLENISFLMGKASKQHYILLLAAIALKPEQFENFVKKLEDLLFYYMITKEPARDLEKRFADWAQEIQKIHSNDELEKFIKRRFLSEMERKKTPFVATFNSLNFATIQKFKLKYILAKFSLFLEKERANGEDASLDEYFKKNIHIEHILPESYDMKALKESFSGSRKDYDLYKEKLGNLTLLEEPINTSIQDAPYNNKRIEYKKSRFYLTRSIVELENVGNNTSINRLNVIWLKSFDSWNKESIDGRQKMLLDLAMKIWQAE